MLPLDPEKYPQDFYYHRTTSPTYREYLHTCGLTTFDIGRAPFYSWKKKIFGDWFGVVKCERLPFEPDLARIKKETQLKHAFVIWIPYGKVDTSRPWRKLWFSDHFEETGYAELVHSAECRVQSEQGKGESEKMNVIHAEQNPPVSHAYRQAGPFDRGASTSSPQPSTVSYLSSWNERSRRARKKYLASGATICDVTPEIFVEAFRKTKVKHWYKSAYISYYKRMVGLDASSIRQWVAYDPSGKIIGGLAVHDFLGDHSVHLVAFSDAKSHEYQSGTGLIDRWFAESYERGYHYLSFDHLRNTGGPKDQKGYTAFKENFLTAHLSFREAYFRCF